MKKAWVAIIIILLVMTGTSSFVSAQEGIFLTLKATPKTSFLRNSDDSNDNAIKKRPTINANFGLGIEYNVTDTFGIGSDILYSVQGQNMKVHESTLNQKLEYIKLPVYISLSTNSSKSISFYGRFGPQISFLIQAKESTGERPTVKNKHKYDSATMGAMVNIGSRFILGHNLYLQTGFYFDFDITNAEEVHYPGYPGDRSITYNVNVGLQTGLKFIIF